MSADGSLVAFVCEKEIYVVGTGAGGGVVPVVPRQLTHDARGTAKTNGLQVHRQSGSLLVVIHSMDLC